MAVPLTNRQSLNDESRSHHFLEVLNFGYFDSWKLSLVATFVAFFPIFFLPTHRSPYDYEYVSHPLTSEQILSPHICPIGLTRFVLTELNFSL